VTGPSKGLYHFSRDETFLTFRTDSVPVDGGPLSPLHDRSRALEAAAWDAGIGDYLPRLDQLIALWTTYLPHSPDVLSAHLHPVLFKDLARARGATGPLLDRLGRATGLGPVSASALVLGLVVKDVAVRTAAQDAVLERASYGELDGLAMGEQARSHLADGSIVGKRLVESLRQVTQAADSTVLPALALLGELLPDLTTRKDAGAFLELSADLAERCGGRLTLPAELASLAAGRSGSQAAKAARRLIGGGH
jgi:hypothetical protein